MRYTSQVLLTTFDQKHIYVTIPFSRDMPEIIVYLGRAFTKAGGVWEEALVYHIPASVP